MKFSKSDINYLRRKTGVNHRTIGWAIRSFGEVVVLESLRRLAVGYEYAPGREEAVFVGICRNVKAAGGEPHGNAVGVSTPSPLSPPASSLEKK